MNISSTLSKSLLPYLPPCFRKRIMRAGLPNLQTHLDQVTFREASSIKDYMSCFSLLHDVYVKAGFIQPTNPPLRITPHHSDPESRVFMGHLSDDQSGQCPIPIYTASLFPDNKTEGLPMDVGFKRQVDKLREEDRRLVEVGCLASHPLYRKGNKNIPMLGNRMLMLYATHNIRATDMLITIHPKYLKIYEDILLFEKIGQISSFSYVNNNPAVALRLNLETVPQRFKKIYNKMPKEKNLYHFFFESGPPPVEFPFDDGKEETEVYYGLDMIKRVVAYSATQPAPPLLN